MKSLHLKYLITFHKLVIEHIVTADLPDGQACPPWIEHNIVWHVVRQYGGRTTWRRIYLRAP